MQKQNFYQTRLAEYTLIAAIGGVGYYTIEVLWRGWSHWTMAIVGMLCFTIYYAICRQTNIPLLLRILLGASTITAVELAVGIIINIKLGWAVWDYSTVPFNFMGQICLRYSLLWCLLCLPAAALCRQLRQSVFGQR